MTQLTPSIGKGKKVLEEKAECESSEFIFFKEFKHAAFAGATAATSSGRCALPREEQLGFKVAKYLSGTTSACNEVMVTIVFAAFAVGWPSYSHKSQHMQKYVKPGRKGKHFRWGAKQGCNEPCTPLPDSLGVLREGFLHKPGLAPLVGKPIQLHPPCASILALGNILPRDAHTPSHSLVSSRVVSVCLFFDMFLR